MLGVLGLVLLNANMIAKEVKENIRFEIYLHEDTRQVDINNLKNKINAEPYVKETRFVSKDSAAAEFTEILGEDFLDVLDFNPLRPSLQVYLYADYAYTDSLEWIVQTIEADNKAMIYEIAYTKDVLEEVNNNMRTWTFWLLSISALLLIIAVALINNTIRLAIYSKRFLIKTMQLVGATRYFIQRPFLWNGILQGMVAGIISIGLIIGILFLVRDKPEFVAVMSIQDAKTFLILFGSMITLGVMMAWFSTWLAVRKYIRIDADFLY